MSRHIQSLYFLKQLNLASATLQPHLWPYNNVLEVAALQLAKAMREIKLNIFLEVLSFNVSFTL